MTVVGHQFITLTVDICVQHGGREAPRCAGLSAAQRRLVQLGDKHSLHWSNPQTDKQEEVVRKKRKKDEDDDDDNDDGFVDDN